MDEEVICDTCKEIDCECCSVCEQYDDCDCVECNSCGETVEETYQGICQSCEDEQTINSLRYQ